MTARTTASRSLKSIAGVTACALGILLLFANLDGIVEQIHPTAAAPSDALGILPALGIAGLHAIQAYTFDRAGFLSSLQQILVSFWPLLLVITGVVLLRNAFGGRFATKYSVTRRSSWEIRL
jgi:hypothetical protein